MEVHELPHVRDLDLLVPNVHGGRRLEIVAEGLPLFGGVQLVVDVTLVSPLRGDLRETVSLSGAARVHMPRVSGAACARRWSGGTLTCFRLLAEAKSRSEPPFFRCSELHVVLPQELSWALSWSVVSMEGEMVRFLRSPTWHRSTNMPGLV